MSTNDQLRDPKLVIFRFSLKKIFQKHICWTQFLTPFNQ